MKPWHQSSILRRFGFRGMALMILGMMYVDLGLDVFYSPIEVEDPHVLHTLLPPSIRFGIWAGTGLVAITVGIIDAIRFDSPLTDHLQVAAWVLLALPPFQRFGSYFFATARHPEWEAFNLTAFYGLFTLLILLAARWPESALIVTERKTYRASKGR